LRWSVSFWTRCKRPERLGGNGKPDRPSREGHNVRGTPFGEELLGLM